MRYRAPCSKCRDMYTVDDTGDTRCAACRTDLDESKQSVHRGGCHHWDSLDKERDRQEQYPGHYMYGHYLALDEYDDITDDLDLLY